MDEVQARKLDRFIQSVNSEVEADIGEIIGEAEKLSREKLETTEDEALLDAFNRIQKSVRDTEAKYRRMYALEEQKYRMDALRHREELSGRIFRGVEEKITGFRTSGKYGEYLTGIISAQKLSENAVIAVSPEDEKYSKALSDKSGHEVITDDSIELGGLMIIDREQGLIIDRTFDSALEEQKKTFSSRYSFKTGN